MKDIRISVQNKIALNRENDTYVCGNSDYRVVFDFDEEWDAYHIKTARFKYNGVYQEAVFTGNECAVPIIQDARMIHVGVYAGNISTSTPAVVIASRSILSGDEQHQEPEYDVYEQLVKLVEAGAVRGEPGPQGPQGEVGPAGSDAEVTAENIGKALGFTPADVETVNQVKNDLADLGDEVNGTLAVGKNKLNPATISSYSVINDSGEIVSSTVNHSVSDKIPIGDIRHVVLSYLNSSDSQGLISESDPNTKIAFYRSDDSFISFASTRNEDVPSDAEYLRVQISKIYITVLGRCMVEFSNSMTTYEVYKEFNVNGLKQDITHLDERVTALEGKTLLEGIADGSIKKVKIIGDSITQGVGGTGFNPNNSTSTTYNDDITTEKEAGTWSWDSETGNTYLGDGEVVFVYSNPSGDKYYRKNSGECYANKLVNYFTTKYGIIAENSGTRGLAFHHLFSLRGVCRDGVKRLMIDQLIKDDDDAVICMFGTNDRADSFATLREEIQATVDYMKEHTKKLVLMASIPARESGETSGSLRMEDVASCICAVARENGVEFVSVNRKMTEYLRNSGHSIGEVTADSLHPNDTGHDLMYRFVLEELGFGSPIS